MMPAPRRHLAPLALILKLAVTSGLAAPANPVGTTIQVPPGFEVTSAAGAPLITFPMLGSFDDRGRLFIAENAGVNYDEKTLAEQLPSRITMLQDTDGDGVFDRSSVFADKLGFPQGALWHEGALYVSDAPSILRLEDRDGDGKADARTVIATGFKTTGNAADVHGPFLHPNGRIYWCHGRKGHEVYQNGGGALVSKGLGARIWSCRPDGSDIRVHAGGGMDNPVEVTFNQEGEIFGTANIFQANPRSDAIIHWVHGGVYPRVDQEPVLAEFARTGDLLPPVTLIGHVAPAGIVLPRSDSWGTEYRSNLFYAEFNTRRVMRVPLERSGATYRAHAQPFATAADPGVHFTDVIEDADGSLLLVNTGAWFRRGCPTSVVARADITGGIYRVRRQDARRTADPRGNTISWKTSSPATLVALLGDSRPAVRDRAVAELARRGEAALPALAPAIEDRNYLARSNAVWTLTRIGSPAARTAARKALNDGDARVREVACQSAFTTADAEAAELLVTRLSDDSPAVQREAARALGRLRDPRAISALGGAAAIGRDPILTHALTYALLEIDAPAETHKLLRHREPLVRRAALIALDRSASAKLEPEPVFAALRETHAELRAAALQIAVRHPEWGRAAAAYLRHAAARADEPATRDAMARLLPAFLPTREVREWLHTQMSPGKNGAKLDPLLVLDAIARSPGTWDESWRELLVSSLKSSNLARAQAALRAMTAHRKQDFSASLQEVGRDTTRPTGVRVAALQLASGSDTVLDAELFAMLVEPLVGAGSAESRMQAAGVLGSAKLGRAHLLKLLEVLPAASPMELPQLLGAFQRGPADPEIGAKLLAKLQSAPGRWGVQQTTLQTLFQRYPAPLYENAAPLISEIMNQNVAKDGRLAELETLAVGGDPARGKAAFLAGSGACLSCHRVGESGGTLGPDLTHIGRIRSTRDLLEAISFPNATIARGYDTFQLTTKEGATLVGTMPRETADTVFVLTADAKENPVPRTSIAKVEPIAMSLMPPGLDRAVEPKVLADLVAFLKSLQ